MAKENKKPASIQAAPRTDKKPVITNQNDGLNISKDDSGMNINSTVIALERIGKMIYDNPNAKQQFNLTDEQIRNYNEFVLSGMTSALIVDIAAKKSKWSLTMNKAQFEIVQRVAADIGVTFDAKFLPAPDESDNVTVEISNDTVNIPKEIVVAAKEETEVVESSVELDPTKFQNEDDLAHAMDYIVLSEKAAFKKFTRIAALLRSYRLIQAKDNAEETAKINEKSHGELLQEAFDIMSSSKAVTHMPIIFNGFGKYIYSETANAMSPVLAFCKLRDASKNSAGVPTVDDNSLVGILRVLVSYTANKGIAAEEAKMTEHKKNLDALSKDKKKNAEGIKDIEGKIAVCKANIEHFNNVIDATHNPTSDFADNFIEDYEDVNSECYRRARQVFKYITQSFYGEELTKKSNQDYLKKNVQQYIGIITNMFRPAANQFDQFSSSRLIDLQNTEGAEKN